MVSSVAVLQVLLWSLASAGAATIASAGQDPGEKPPIVVTESGRVITPAVADSGGGNHSKQDVSILQQINRVNDDGSYTFGYEASDGSFKLETRDVAGNVKGMFGFLDETGALKRVSYSASNSSSAAGTRVAGTTTTSPSAEQTIPVRTNNKDDDNESGSKSSAAGVKKVLVSKRLVTVPSPEQDVQDKRRGGSDLRRQLSRNDDGGDAPDVYGVHGGSGMDSASGPVSPVVSALMAELSPVRVYRPVTLPPSSLPRSSPQPQQQPLQPPTTLPAVLDRQYTISSRQAQEDDEPPQYSQRVVPVRYRQPAPGAETYQQPEYQQPAYQPSSTYQPSPTYPVQLSAPIYQQQQQQQPIPVPVYGPNLVALRDELMELILSFVQSRVSQLVSIPSYSRQLPPVAPYPMPYQQPNYYVPSYYQGPRIPVTTGQPPGLVVRQIVNQQGYATGAATDTVQQSSPKITQTIKDGLIRMLLSTSPRYDPEYANREQSTPPRLTYRRTTQSTPVRSVQIVEDDGTAVGSSSRPVTTESPN